MEYYWASGRSLTELSVTVDKYIKDGWKPQGGIAVDYYFENQNTGVVLKDKWYIQALIMEKV